MKFVPMKSGESKRRVIVSLCHCFNEKQSDFEREPALSASNESNECNEHSEHGEQISNRANQSSPIETNGVDITSNARFNFCE